MPSKVRGELRQKKKRIVQPKKSGLTLPEPNNTLKLSSPGDNDGVEKEHIGEVQRSLAKRNHILRQLKGINERVQQILESIDGLNDETHLVQFQVYKDQLKRLISRYEEAAKEREKVLINVNVIFQKELSVILDERANSGTGFSDIPEDLLRDVKDHPFSFNLKTSSEAVQQLNTTSNRLIACVKDMLMNKQELKAQASSLTSDTLLQRRHERIMQEMTDKAVENIKLSNTVSQQEEELMRLRATFANLRSKGKRYSRLEQLQDDLDKACDSVAAMHSRIEKSLHESSDQVKLPPIAAKDDEEDKSSDLLQSGKPSVSKAKRLYKQVGRPVQLKGGGVSNEAEKAVQLKEKGVYQQVETTVNLEDRGRSAQIKDEGVYQEVERPAGSSQQVEESVQVKDKDADATMELLTALSGDYNQFNKLSVSVGKKMLLAAPKLTKEREDITESIRRCAVSDGPPVDLANAGSYVSRLRKAAVGIATKIDSLAQDVMADSNSYISSLAADRSLQPEVLKARKDKYHRSKERVRKLTTCFSDCYKNMMDSIDSTESRLNMDASNHQEGHTDRLQEPDRMTQVAGLDGEGREEEYTDTAQEHNWAASTTSQQWHLPEGVREATEHGKAPAEKTILHSEDTEATRLPHIAPSHNAPCDTKLKKSMLQLQKMTELDEDSLPVQPSAAHTSPPKQPFCQWKTQGEDLPANLQTRKKKFKGFKQHYIPTFSSFQGYHRSIVQNKQEKGMRNASKGNAVQKMTAKHRLVAGLPSIYSNLV